MGTRLEEISILLVIILISWVFKILIFRIKKIERKDEESFFVVRVLEKNPIINLGFLYILYNITIDELYVINWKFICVKVISGFLLLLAVINTIKVITINFQKLIKNGEQKIWCAVYLCLFALVLIFRADIGGVLMIFGIGLLYIYLLMVFIINILEVKKFLF